MKKHKEIAVRLLALFIILTGISVQYAKAQTPTVDSTLPAQPKMYVEKEVSQEAITRYDAIKGHQLGPKETRSIYFNLKAFKQMLTYFSNKKADSIRVYIGLYLSGSFPLKDPKLDDSSLTIFFSPEQNSKMLGFYWLPSNATYFDPIKDNQLTFEQAKKSAGLYDTLSSKMGRLINTISINDASNKFWGYYPNCDKCSIYPDNDGNLHFSDTRSVIYSSKFFTDELLKEIDYQHNEASTSSDKIKGIRAYFAQHQTKKDRLYLQFSFVKNKGGKDADFGIEEDGNFNRRPLKNANDSLMQATSSFDNGQMCPPNCATKQQ